MIRIRFQHLLGLVALALMVFARAHAGAPLASEHVRIMEPWSRALPAVSTNGAAYFVAANEGGKDARIVEGRSPIAKRVELHTHTMEDGVARMSRIEGGIVVPAGGSVTLAPGGIHVMLMNLNEPLAAGKVFPLTLTFEDGSTMDVEVRVLSAEEAAKMGNAVGHAEMKAEQ